MPKKEAVHSELSPSSSHRWINCPGSATLCKGEENESNEASTRGTGAHALAYELLTGKDYKVGDTIKFKDGDKDESMVIDDEVWAAVHVYTEHINTMAEYMANPELWLEEKVKYHGEKGTSDAILKDHQTLHVMDYKNGRVAVPVKTADGDLNTQLKIYAYAALKKHDPHGEIQWVVFHIIQPNSPDVDPIQTTEPFQASDIRRWGDVELKGLIKKARDPKAELVPGDWCRWCPAAAKCPALVNHVNALAAADFAGVDKPALPDVVSLSTAQVANILKWSPVLDAFIAAVAARALDEMQRGAIYPGFKLVRKKTNRAWNEKETDVVTTEGLRKRLLEAGAPTTLKAADLLGQPKLLSPKQIEDKFKWAKPVVAKVAFKPEGDLTVADVNDGREAVQPAITDFKDLDDPEVLI